VRLARAACEKASGGGGAGAVAICGSGTLGAAETGTGVWLAGWMRLMSGSGETDRVIAAEAVAGDAATAGALAGAVERCDSTWYSRSSARDTRDASPRSRAMCTDSSREALAC
jgi:hypothetical protein